MDITFTVRLPIDGTSVPFIRGLCRQALRHLRVEQPVIEEIALALTEACADVVQHAGHEDSYEVTVSVDDQVCRMSIVDQGGGADPATRGDGARPAEPDGGGGLRVMQSLVDRLDFQHGADGRHRVTLEKRLVPGPALRLVDPA